MKNRSAVRAVCAVLYVVIISSAVSLAQAPQQKPSTPQPWMNKFLSPDQRADMVLKQMTLDEKVGLLHGQGFPGWGPPSPIAYMSNGGAGFVVGIPRLGIPMIQMSDAAYGVRGSAENGR